MRIIKITLSGLFLILLLQIIIILTKDTPDDIIKKFNNGDSKDKIQSMIDLKEFDIEDSKNYKIIHFYNSIIKNENENNSIRISAI